MLLDSAPAAPTPTNQQQAADPLLSAFVTANAGSGKTSTLVQRVARLLLHGATPGTVLCVTYTKAAAAEMQRRLYEQLGHWAVASDEQLREALTEIGEAPDVVPARRARQLFAEALETPGGLKIQTIHAFCEKLLRRFPLEAGVSPGFQVAEGADAEALSASARVRLAHRVLAEPAAPLATAYEHFAVELAHTAFDDLLKVLEGERQAIARIVSDSDFPAAIWRTCGFADGQPRDPAELRVSSLIPPALDLSLWRQAAAAFGASSTKTDLACAEAFAAVIADVEAGQPQWDAARKLLFTGAGEPRWRGDKPPRCLRGDPALLDWLRWEQARIEAARVVACGATVARDTAYALALGAAYGGVYEDLKHASGRLDFGDLVHRTHDLLTRDDGAAWVLFKLDGGIDHILVDEAQDTAPQQWDVVRKLADEFFVGAGKPSARKLERTVFAVGDEKQSIYSFQGARPERLRIELQAYSKLVTGVDRPFRGVALEESWRSTPEVLAFVDKVFEPEETRAGVPRPEGENVLTHKPRRLDRGCVDLWPLEVEAPALVAEAWDRPLDAEPDEGARKRLARRIAAEINAAVERRDAVLDRSSRTFRAVGYGDFLILVRRRSDGLFDEIIRQLKLAKVPVGGADRLPLSEHILFKDLLALARIALYPQDDLLLAALLRSPFFDVDEESLAALAYGRGPQDLWRALRTRADERPEWRTAYAVLSRARREAPASQPYEFFARFLASVGADGRSMTQRVLTRLGREAEDALEAFLGEAIAAEGRGVLGMEAFAAALERSALEVKREQEDGRGEVRVMTVHGAKGLEAPVVILPDTAAKAKAQGPALLKDGQGGYLYAPRKGDDCEASGEARLLRETETDAESLRLLYVALTRARDRLIVCGRAGAKKDGEAEGGSWYDWCLRAAGELPTRAVALADGTAIRRYGVDPVTAFRTTVPADKHPLPDWARRAAPPEHAAAPYASPSQLAAAARAPGPSPLAEATAGLGRYRRGDLIHGLLETLPDLPPEARPAAAASLLARHADLTDDQRAEMATAALTVLEDARFAEVFGPDSRPEVAIAGSAPSLPPTLKVSGRVDRLVVTPGRVLVVDYKTNRPAPDRIEDADPAYRTQMAVYVAVLRAIYPNRRVEAALVWTDGPKLMPVPDKVVADALAALPGAR